MTTCRHIMIFCACCLLGIGFVAYAYNTGLPLRGDGTLMTREIHNAIMRQALWLAAGATLMWRCAAMDYHCWRGWSLPVLTVVWCALVLTWFRTPLRHVVYYTCWLGCYPILLAPSRWCLLAFVVWLACIVSAPSSRKQAAASAPCEQRLSALFRDVLFPLWSLALTLSLLIGRAHVTLRLLLVVTALWIAIAAKAKKLAWGIAALFMAGVALFIAHAPVRLIQAIGELFSGDRGPRCITFSQFCLNRGSWLGTGLGVTDTRFIPNATEMPDFMIAIIGEQMGWFTVIAIAVLLLALLAAGLYTALHAADPFGTLLASALTCLLGLQSLLHFGVVLGWFPIIGVPLPFVSEVGSNACLPMVCAGMLLSIAQYRTPGWQSLGNTSARNQ